MKKLLAVMLAVIMAFSMTVSVSAVDAGSLDDIEDTVGGVAGEFNGIVESGKEIYEEIQAEDYASAIEGAFALAVDLFEAIHSLVHALSEIFDFGCPFCEEGLDSIIGGGNNGGCDCNCDCNCGDKDEEPENHYESANTVIGEEFANKDVEFIRTYPQGTDAAYVFTAPTKSIVIDGVATANINKLIVLEDGAVAGKIVFKDNATFNYFHATEGFKLLLNYSGTPVAIVLAGDVRLSNGTYITAANIGDYIVGPYTVSVAA